MLDLLSCETLPFFRYATLLSAVWADGIIRLLYVEICDWRKALAADIGKVGFRAQPYFFLFPSARFDANNFPVPLSWFLLLPLPDMNRQPANVSTLWFFIKTGILCVLVVVVQGYATFLHNGGTMAHAPVQTVTVSRASAKTATKATETKQMTERQKEIASLLPIQPPKPSLSTALMKAETYAPIKDEFKRKLDTPYGKLHEQYII